VDVRPADHCLPKNRLGSTPPPDTAPTPDGVVMIDGLVRCGRSRNTLPATEFPMVVEAH